MQLLTTQQLAPMLNIKRGNVTETLKRHGISPVQKDGKSFLFDIVDVIKVSSWSGILNSKLKVKPSDKITIRKSRSDQGICRKANSAAVRKAVEYAKSIFLSGGMRDLKFACHNAVRLLHADCISGVCSLPVSAVETIDPNWFYQRWVRRKDEYFIGPYHKESWEELWKQAWKQHDSALRTAHSRRNVSKIFENAGWAGEGFGFGWMVTLDDRTADVWTEDDGAHTLPNGIYVWCNLTGALLFVEPASEVTTQAYIRAILGAIFVNNLERAPLICLENSKAAKSARITDLVNALYTQEDLGRIWADKNLVKLAHGERGPIFRNVPHVAREFGKAFAERSFGVIKREHDAHFNPPTFQGGNRTEAVQMHRSNTPWFLAAQMTHPRHTRPDATPSTDDYFMSIYKWSQTDYLDRERASLKEWSKAHKLPPTRRAMVEYYGGNTGRTADMQLPIERFAIVIFAATPKISFVKCKAPGTLSLMRDGVMINLVGVGISVDIVGRDCGVVPVPTQPGKYIVVVLKFNKRKREVDRFVCIAEDLTSTNVEDAIEHREVARSTREQLIASIDAQINDARKGNEHARLKELNPALNIGALEAPEWIGELGEATEVEAESFFNNLEDDDLTPDDLDRLLEL